VLDVFPKIFGPVLVPVAVAGLLAVVPKRPRPVPVVVVPAVLLVFVVVVGFAEVPAVPAVFPKMLVPVLVPPCCFWFWVFPNKPVPEVLDVLPKMLGIVLVPVAVAGLLAAAPNRPIPVPAPVPVAVVVVPAVPLVFVVVLDGPNEPKILGSARVIQ
jgi:hypothetical protein